MMRGRMSHSSGVLCAVALTLAITTGCGVTAGAKKAAKQAPPLQAVSIETVKLSSQSIGNTYLGTITPFIQTNLSPAASGHLKSLNVRAGQHVTKGETLATLDESISVPQRNSADQAAAALASAQQAYQDAQALYSDNLSSDQQVSAAKNQVSEDKAALATAKANLDKAQVSEQQTLAGTATTQQEKDALSAVITADQNALDAAKKDSTLAQSNLDVLKQAYDTAQKEYGSITSEQVQDASKAYQDALSHYKSWEQGSFSGSNPYASVESSDQTIYQNLNNGYSALQQATQQYNQGQQALQSAQSTVSADAAQLATAQKNQSDAAPPASDSFTSQSAKATYQAAQASYQQAEVQYQAAVTSLTLAKKIAADKTQAKQTLDNAENQLHQERVAAKTANRSLQVQIQDGKVISPISGIVQAVGAQIGESVGPQTNLVTIASDSPQMATVDVPESDIGKVTKGAAMQVNVPTLNQTFDGHVSAIHPQLDQATNEYPVDVTLAGNHSQLLPGIQVEGQLVSGGSKKELLVPADAVLSLQSGAQEVFVYQNGVVHTRLVQVGAMTSTQYQITSGLKAGDELVVQGQNLLSDGDKVKVVSEDGSTTTNATNASGASTTGATSNTSNNTITAKSGGGHKAKGSAG